MLLKQTHSRVHIHHIYGFICKPYHGHLFPRSLADVAMGPGHMSIYNSKTSNHIQFILKYTLRPQLSLCRISLYLFIFWPFTTSGAVRSQCDRQPLTLQCHHLGCPSPKKLHPLAPGNHWLIRRSYIWATLSSSVLIHVASVASLL